MKWIGDVAEDPSGGRAMLPANHTPPKPETSSSSSSGNGNSSSSNGLGAHYLPPPSSGDKTDPVVPLTATSALMLSSSVWDPMSPTNSASVLSTEAKRRVQSEIMNCLKNPIDGIYMTPDEHDMSNFHAIVLGTKDTPYEGGLFYFYIKIPSDYPWKPPRVKLMTTCNGTVRFNPNLYASGKVCLSILGTWAGPSWTPSLTLQSVLLSIQSLMNEEPFYNEPFYEGKQKYRNMKKMAEDYSEDIRFHTIRVAVLDMVEGSNGDTQNLPQILRDKVVSLFKEHYATYARIITDNLASTKYGYAALKSRLAEVRSKVEKASKKSK